MVCQSSDRSQHCWFCHCTLKPHHKKHFHTVKQGLSLSVAVHELIRQLTGCQYGSSPHQTTHADNAAMQLSEGRYYDYTGMAKLHSQSAESLPSVSAIHAWTLPELTRSYCTIVCGFAYLLAWINHIPFIFNEHIHVFQLELSSLNQDYLSNIYGILNNDQYS